MVPLDQSDSENSCNSHLMIAEIFWKLGLCNHFLKKWLSPLTDFTQVNGEIRISLWLRDFRHNLAERLWLLFCNLWFSHDLLWTSSGYWLLTTIPGTFQKDFFFSLQILSSVSNYCFAILRLSHLPCFIEKAIFKNVAICLGSHNEIPLLFSLHNHLHNSF